MATADDSDGRARSRVEDEMEAESEGGRGWEDVATRACVFLLFPSRTNADKHRPRSCDFEALSLIKALIKEKGACYRADN